MPDPAPHIVVSLTVEEPRWRDVKLDVPFEDFLEALIRAGISPFEIAALTQADAVEVSLVLMNDADIQGINKEYRGKDAPTNVLSFPQFSAAELKSGDLTPHGFLPLGDILLSLDTITAEAEAQDKDFDAHLAHMVVHGTLHLLGYDHIKDAEAEEMESLEKAILAGFGYKDPYPDNHDDTADGACHG